MPKPDGTLSRQDEFITSQQHRDRALRIIGERQRRVWSTEEIGAAQVHATLAVYEGLYELLGDDSTLDFIKREIVAMQEQR